MSSIVNLMRKLSNVRGEMYCKVCTVDAVDEDKRVCDVSPIDGSAPLLDVNLQANQESKHGIVSFPKKGSYVVVGFLTPDVGVVLLTDEIEKIDIAIEETSIVVDKDGVVINKGENTTAKADELKTQLDKMSSRIDGIIDAINSSTVVGVPQDGGTTLWSLFKVQIALIQDRESFSEIENDKIKH